MEPKQGGGGDDNMKRSASELALEDFIKKIMMNDNKDKKIEGGFLSDACSGDVFSSSVSESDIMNGFSSTVGLAETLLWSQNLSPKKQCSNVSVTMDSQSSICVGSPMSANKPNNKENQARAGSSGSSQEQSDDEDIEIEAGPCEQSTDPLDLKRIKRMNSNRESARRSRKRKQDQLADFELQAEQLRVENSSLYKQLTDATHQYREADTDNRVLKSDVEALRAKVKLVEDMLTRGSFTCSINQLLQDHLNSPQSYNMHNLGQVANVSPTVTVHGDDASYGGRTVSGQNSVLGLGNVDVSNGNLKNGIMSDAVSCVSDIWA
ncbi:bZIP_1 domain-containing protein/bZIP_C domain-containing protein [Cephalotus follicularis]|uniref:BZIP_1 domain-containing protein/bZIP_C domain-containing protein n=1 Tax=Cephalotus follicularis TaxID=3775 RepID=A0A1Q3B6V2_CEPFO|nr:bZIP_1 domain-containing protein/bZIP_C domain-containing protein [Cephalotus follicularis]